MTPGPTTTPSGVNIPIGYILRGYQNFRGDIPDVRIDGEHTHRLTASAGFPRCM